MLTASLLAAAATFTGGADPVAPPQAVDAPQTAQAAGPPNVLFILADDLGWQDSSVAFGSKRTELNRRFETPALERLASEGTLFTQAYACAVCSPTRVSLFTGQNAARHGVTQWTYLSGDQPSSDLHHPTLDPAEWNWNGLQPVAANPGPHAVHAIALPERLRQAGYRTLHFGKGHLGARGTPGADPQAFGFDVRVGGRDAGGAGSYRGMQRFGALKHPNGPWRAWDLDHYFDQDVHLSEALTREATAAIRQATADGVPFFCYLAHYAPHTPIEPDERFAPRFRAAGLDEPEAAYASLVSGVDRSVGDLLALLDELGVADDTLVVFTSDNGGLSHAKRGMSAPHTHNRPLSSGKGSHHEGGIRVPLIVRRPGVVSAGARNDVPVIVEDWFPTLLDVAGAAPPPADDHPVDGLSLRPLWEGRPPAELTDRALIWHFPNFWGPLAAEPVRGPGMGPCSVIRRGDWKLIYYHDRTTDEQTAAGPFELFNLADDVSESTNLAARRPAVTKKLASELGRTLRDRGAVLPVRRATGHRVPWPDELR